MHYDSATCRNSIMNCGCTGIATRARQRLSCESSSAAPSDSSLVRKEPYYYNTSNGCTPRHVVHSFSAARITLTFWQYQNYTHLSFHACDRLQVQIARDFQSLEAVEEASFPILHSLQTKLFHNAELNSLLASSSITAPQPSDCMPHSRHQFLRCLQNLDENVAVPFGRPLLETEFLGVDAFYSLTMLACLEIPHVALTQLPSLQGTPNLYDMVRSSREAYANAPSNESFTASDVQQALHDFASSSDNTKQWLFQTLSSSTRTSRETLDAIVDNFMEVLPKRAMGLSKHSLATCALFYHFIPAPKLRKGPMLLGPTFRRLSNFEGTRGKQYPPGGLRRRRRVGSKPNACILGTRARQR